MSKRFRFFCDEVKIQEIILHESEVNKSCSKSYWFVSNKIINYKDSISLETFKAYRSFFKLDQNLRRLHLNDDHFIWFKIEIFNSLIQLEQLEIEGNSFFFDCTLTLPNLKISKIYARNARFQQFKLKTPKLEALDCYNLYSIVIEQPETIKHLRIETCDSRLEHFINLEVLECGQIRKINKEILSTLRKLKALCGYEKSTKKFEFETHRNLIDKISFIMKQKLVLRRTELKVYLQGVQLTDGNNLNDFKLKLRDTRFQIGNYANLYSNLFFINYVNYSHLIEMKKQVPGDYFNKFFRIRMVVVTTKVNRDNFILFVSKLNFVEYLCLTNASLDQSLIDHLLDICNLKMLIVNENRTLNLDFACILKCKRLTHFRTNQPFLGSFDLALKAFSRLTKLVKFVFAKDDETVEIKKDYHFDLKCYRHSTDTTTFSKLGIKFNELTIYCNHLANKTGVKTRRSTKLTNPSPN